MMAHDICVIDDSIPVTATIDDAQRLNRSNLLLLLGEFEEWSEPEIRNLVDSLVNDTSSWNVSAFNNPDIYLNALENEGYRPEIIIYDWEYTAGSSDPVTTLERILEATFALVYVYSRADHEGQIKKALTDNALRMYKGKRLNVLLKDEVDSPKRLLKEAADLYEKNFSFRFGKDLRLATIKALEQVLVEFGKHDINFVLRLLSEGETEETDIKSMIAEKVKHCLMEDESLINMLTSEQDIDKPLAENLMAMLQGKVLDTIVAAETDLSQFGSDSSSAEENMEVSRQLWYHRLYYKPADQVVRRGDIVFHKETEQCFLIITADCDLLRFWKKNFGFINLVPLYDIDRDAAKVQDFMLMRMSENKLKRTIKEMHIKSLSLTIHGFPDGPFLLPFLSTRHSTSGLIGFPKAMTSIYISPPSTTQQRLLYQHLEKYERIVALSEPFLTPIVQICLGSISGYGTPDYPDVVSKAINQDFQKLLPEDVIGE